MQIELTADDLDLMIDALFHAGLRYQEKIEELHKLSDYLEDYESDEQS